MFPDLRSYVQVHVHVAVVECSFQITDHDDHYCS